MGNLKQGSIDFDVHYSDYDINSEENVGTNSKVGKQYLETILRNSYSEAVTERFFKELVSQKSMKCTCEEVRFIKRNTFTCIFDHKFHRCNEKKVVPQKLV